MINYLLCACLCMRSTYVDGGVCVFNVHVKIIGNPSAMPQVPGIFLFESGSLIGLEHFWPCKSSYFPLPQLLRIYLSLLPPLLSHYHGDYRCAPLGQIFIYALGLQAQVIRLVSQAIFQLSCFSDPDIAGHGGTGLQSLHLVVCCNRKDRFKVLLSSLAWSHETLFLEIAKQKTTKRNFILRWENTACL